MWESISPYNIPLDGDYCTRKLTPQGRRERNRTTCHLRVAKYPASLRRKSPELIFYDKISPQWRWALKELRTPGVLWWSEELIYEL